ncbi:uncharacterized protein [Chaetodon trifascialis]|uniref:uncharacterized protein n=1 Tax=Chaetodon trifascialis TaxID=109706 RepID=UPI003993C14F
MSHSVKHRPDNDDELLTADVPAFRGYKGQENMTALLVELWSFIPTAVKDFLLSRPFELKANTMFRFSLVVCVSLIFGITAKPYKPWNKLTDEAFQDAVMSIDENGKMSWGMEVEPPEDMDETNYEIDPHMKIWKNTKGSGQDKQPLQAEEDLDELNHPSVPDILKVQIQNVGALPAADVQAEDVNVKNYQEAEEDKDDIDHHVFSKTASEEPEQDRDDIYHKAMEELNEYQAPLMAKSNAAAEVHAVHSEPEMDKDDLYHRDDQRLPVQMEPLGLEVRGEREVRIHLEPEEDRDSLYHKDVSPLVPHRGDTEEAVPFHVPFQRMYSEPEEDLDHLYHQ